MSVIIGNSYNNSNIAIPTGQVLSAYSRSDGVSNGTSSTVNAGTGDIVSGEILSKDGNQITLKLDNNQTISAKLDGNADISVGQKLLFEIGKSSNEQTVLRPLYANMANYSSARAAITQAGLPVNETTLTFTSEMMKEGMAVNKNALLDMARTVAGFSNVDSNILVQMTKLGLQINESNITQFTNYSNLEHQILGDADNIAAGLTNMLQDVANSADGINIDSFVNITNEILNLVDLEGLDVIAADTESLATDITSDINSVVGESNNLGQNVSVETGADQALNDINGNTNSGDVINQQNISSVAAEAGNRVSALDIEFGETIDSSSSVTQGADSVLTEGLKSDNVQVSNISDFPDMDASMMNKDVSVTDENVVAGKAFTINDNLSLTAQEQTNLYNDLNNLLQLFSENQSLSSPLNPAEVLESIKGMLSKLNENTEASVNPELAGKLSDFVKSDEFGKLLKDSVKAQFMIKPQDVAKEGKIDDLYERILRQTSKINDLMNSVGQQNSDVAKSSSNMAENVRFMNQLNEFVNYVQLPLKMAGEDAHGELYVYTKKKNLQNKDGNFSALLHLDMDHLGPMDVYVAMQNYTKVNTHFYLQTDELLDFVESHIDELNKRLEALGYNANCQVTQKNPSDGIKPITEEFMKVDESDKPIQVSKMCFDVRA